MNDQPKSTFARRVRAASARARKYEIRDDIVIGLGLTIQPSGARTFFFARMVHGRRRFSTIGSADVLTIPEARREARRMIASYIEPARTDGGPRTPGHPMTAFAEEFLERQGRYWKPRTVETNSRVVHKNILSAFGHMIVDAITDDDVKRGFASLGERPGIANRAMPVLSVMMRMAELWGYRAHNTNPCNRTRRYRMKPRERFLTAQEMARLNAVLTRDEFWCPHIVAIVRLLMLTGCRHARDILARIRAGDNPADDIRKEKTAPTVAMLADEYLRRCDPYWKPSGRKTIRIYLKARILPTFGKMPVERVGPELALTGCRRGEVLNLRWRDIGDNAIALPDSKTGPRSVPLGGAARAVIKALPEPRDPDAYLFPSLAGGRHAHRVVACWQAVCGDANLGKVRLHDLRHTAASHAVMSGENLPLVGKLLGHRRHDHRRLCSSCRW